MNDKYLEILHEAARAWQLTALSEYHERLEFVAELHAKEIFSLNQLAKICRVSVPSVSRRFKANTDGGGRLSPECLTALIELRKFVLTGDAIPKNLLRLIVINGTSLGTAAKLTGTDHNKLYRRYTNA